MNHFSRNIISASFGEGYINLNPLSAANTPPPRRPGGFCYFYLIISWAYSGVRIHPGWQVLVPFESPISLFFQCFAMHWIDKCGVQCVCGGGGFEQWHVAFSTKHPTHGASFFHKCFCFLFWLRVFAPADLSIWWHFLDSCLVSWGNVSSALLIHGLWLKEPQFATICGHIQTNARLELQLYIPPLLKYYFIVPLWRYISNMPCL